MDSQRLKESRKCDRRTCQCSVPATTIATDKKGDSIASESTIAISVEAGQETEEHNVVSVTVSAPGATHNNGTEGARRNKSRYTEKSGARKGGSHTKTVSIDEVADDYNLETAKRQLVRKKVKKEMSNLSKRQADKSKDTDWLKAERERITKKIAGEIDLTAIKESILKGEYKQEPRRVVEIPKANGKTRIISIGEDKDFIVATALKEALENNYERLLSKRNVSYAYRKGLDTLELVTDIMKSDHRYVTAMDITDFFGSLEWNIVMQAVMDLHIDNEVANLIKHIVKDIEMIQNGKSIKPNKGIVQGAVLSPLWANVVGNRIDCEIISNLNGCEDEYKYYRYADDIIVTTNSTEHIQPIIGTVRNVLQAYELNLNVDKTKIYDRREGLYMFGWNIVNNKILWNQEQINKLKDKLKTAVGEKRMEIIAGWLNYQLRIDPDPMSNSDNAHMLENFSEEDRCIFLGVIHKHQDKERCNINKHPSVRPISTTNCTLEQQTMNKSYNYVLAHNAPGIRCQWLTGVRHCHYSIPVNVR